MPKFNFSVSVIEEVVRKVRLSPVILILLPAIQVYEEGKEAESGKLSVSPSHMKAEKDPRVGLGFTVTVMVNGPLLHPANDPVTV